MTRPSTASHTTEESNHEVRIRELVIDNALTEAYLVLVELKSMKLSWQLEMDHQLQAVKAERSELVEMLFWLQDFLIECQNKWNREDFARRAIVELEMQRKRLLKKFAEEPRNRDDGRITINLSRPS